MGETENPSFSRFRDFWTCPWVPKPTMFVFGDTRILQTIQESITNTFSRNIFLEISNFGHSITLYVFEKTNTDKSRRCISCFLKILISYSRIYLTDLLDFPACVFSNTFTFAHFQDPEIPELICFQKWLTNNKTFWIQTHVHEQVLGCFGYRGKHENWTFSCEGKTEAFWEKEY